MLFIRESFVNCFSVLEDVTEARGSRGVQAREGQLFLDFSLGGSDWVSLGVVCGHCVRK